MKKILIVVLCFLIGPVQLMSQVLPKEGSKLNYRLVGFSFPAAQGAGNYEIEIAAGAYYSEDSFTKNIVCSLTSEGNKIIAEVPSFGANYTWRVVEKGRRAGNEKNKLHHFSTMFIPAVDSNMARLRVLKKAEKYKDAYVFLDGMRALYDMNGKPVWFLPDIDGFSTEKSLLRDLKLTPQGTITFLYEERGAYEINYNGEILWKAPNNGAVNGDSHEHYHHEFTRLANGNYMILGSEFEQWSQKLPSATDSSFVIFHDDKLRRDGYTSLPFGTVIEYDKMGNVVWQWKSSKYYRLSDIYYHKGRGGKPDIAPHENSFYFDEQDNVLYIGFRNISRILKVKYPEGNVLTTYGEIYEPGVQEKGNGLFCRQHSVRRSGDGYLYLYNNNVCGLGPAPPTIIKLEEPANGDGSLKKIWDYTCTTEGVLDTTHMAYQFPTGGNVNELPDHSLLVNMSTTYSKVFVLGDDKKILWSAIPEKWSPDYKRWDMAYDYRASMITSRSELEKLIWASEP